MKEKQELQETYTDLLNNTTDPAFSEVIQKLDRIANAPYPPANLNWTTIKALYNKEMEEKNIDTGENRHYAHRIPHFPLKAITTKQRRLQRYGLSLIAAILVIGLVIFTANTLWGNGIGGRSAGIRMQLTVVENGIVPSRAEMEKAVTILSARFSQFGLEGSNVSLKQTNGQSTILVTLPSFGGNEQQAVDKLIEPGKIEFWDTGSKVLARGTSFNPKDYAQYNPGDQPWFTNRDLNLDSLFVSRDLTSNYYTIGFTMQNEAINRYARFTGSRLGDALTITLDGKVLMSVLIKAEIPNGSTGIADNFTLQQANALVAALKSGVLPVQLRELT